MRKIAILLILFVTAAQAQQMKRFRNEATVAADDAAPIGVDLMYGNKEGVTVFPNASNDHLLISVAGKPSVKKSVTIYNSSGTLILRTGTRENTYLVDVSDLRKDLYFIEVSSGSKVYRKKWYRS
jgi:hypothetical protein